MKLSIIIPAYNCMPTLDRAVQSALDQTIKDLEVIIVDDGSTDNTGILADEIANTWPRIKVIHQANAGPSKARQAGLAEAKGEWVTFLDSDDYIEHSMCEKLIDACIKENVNMATCNFTIENETTLTISRWYWKPGKYNVKDNLIWSDTEHDIGFSCGKVYNVKTLKSLNVPYPDCDVAEDAVWNAELFYLLKEMVIIDDPLYHYIIYNDSLSHRTLNAERRMKTINCLEALYDKYKSKKDFQSYWRLLKPFMSDVLARKSGDRQIDFVVPYVDCNDKNWYKLYKQYQEEDLEDKDIRFNNNGMFPLFWRCLYYNMKDIAVIHLIVQSESQVPSWLDRSKVHIVTHDMIMPKKYLPTFNSSAIEMFVQNILGLSDNFIYANDDFYVMTNLSAYTFFDGRKILNTYTPKKFKDEENVLIWEKTFANATKLAYTSLGLPMPDTFDYYSMEHTIRAFNRKRMIKAYNLLEKEINKSITRFRADNNMNIFLFGVIDYLNIDAKSQRNYNLEVISTNDLDDFKKKLDNVPQIMCINDTEISKGSNDIKEYLNTLFKSPCSYETYDSM